MRVPLHIKSFKQPSNSLRKPFYSLQYVQATLLLLIPLSGVYPHRFQESQMFKKTEKCTLLPKRLTIPHLRLCNGGKGVERRHDPSSLRVPRLYKLGLVLERKPHALAATEPRQRLGDVVQYEPLLRRH